MNLYLVVDKVTDTFYRSCQIHLIIIIIIITATTTTTTTITTTSTTTLVNTDDINLKRVVKKYLIIFIDKLT